ncbi:hypothetical protein F53441_388 [Fusarium austroafricanum]|uniref:Uncharacterized protein n=1 Tax=Fusarium austroafricanum TaxID=2364996 RepID=A0A8H4KY56_9HYPO|nr:hypothetical protein F53441_388 [Fusarium austroafricanum]
MTLPETKGKHLLSPQPEQQKTKKSRAIYIAESPGGTMGEADPSVFHHPGASASHKIPAGDKDPKIEETGIKPLSPPTESLLESYSFRPAADSSPANPQSTASQQVGKEQPPKQNSRHKYTNHDLSQDHLSTLSVREKLRKGIAMGFVNNLAYRHASRDSMTVHGMLKRTDAHHNIDPDLTSFHFIGVPEQDGRVADMVNHELVNQEAGTSERERVNFHIKKTKHIQARSSQLLIASQRLQAVTGTANCHPHAPFPMHDPYSNLIMHIEELPCKDNPHLASGPPNSSGLMSWLERACRRFGYWKLELDSLNFKQDVMNNRLTNRSLSLGSKTTESINNEVPFEVLELYTPKGSITLYEVNIVYGTPPLPQRWTWFKIVKPLFDITGPVPGYLQNTPDTTMVFAIPTTKIEKIKEEDNAIRQLVLEWKFSQNGIPNFAVTPHPLFMKEFPPDFLWIQRAPNYSHEESWWKEVGEIAINDRDRWNRVQELMARNLCLVVARSKEGGSWVQVGPEAPKEDHARNMMPNSGPGNRRAKTTRGTSGLRNEV